MSRSVVLWRLRWQTAGRPGGKGQSRVVPRGFEKRQEVDPAWPPVQVPLCGMTDGRIVAESVRGAGKAIG
jgi:hypothetical protein